MANGFKPAFISLFFFIVIVSFSPAYAASISPELVEGFNFVSFDIDVQQSPDAILKSNALIDDIYAYSNAAGSFLSAVSGELKSIQSGRGYIIKANKNTSLTLEGVIPAATESVQLRTGFNLVGASKMPEGLKSSGLMNKSVLIKGLYKWSQRAGAFLQVVRRADGSFELLDQIDFLMDRNSSFFVNASGALTFIYENGAMKVEGAAPLAKVEKPVITPPGGTYENEISMVISCATPSAILKYSLDGSDPSAGGGYEYTSPVLIKNDCVVKSVALFSGMVDSEISTNAYYFKAPPRPAVLILSASKTLISADGSDETLLSATLKDQFGEIMAGYEIEFFAGTEKLSGHIFKTSNEGTYEIQARAAGLISNVVVVKAIGPAKYSVSGRITDESGSGVAGVAVSFSGGFAQALTDPGGYFTSDGLSGTIEISASKASYIFKPASRTVSAGETGLSFKAMTSDFAPPSGKAAGTVPDGHGPWNLRLLSASSSDGLNFTKNSIIKLDQADVPDIALDGDGWIYLYYTCWTVGSEMNKTVVAISADGGSSWIYKKLNLSGFLGMASPVDPDIQILSDGTFRLYLTSSPVNQKPRTYYAEGADGVNFSKGSDTPAFQQTDKDVMDPSVALIGSVWHYFAGGAVGGGEGSNWHASSTDGKIFTYNEAAVFSTGGKNFLVSNIIKAPGGWRFYGFSHAGPDEASVIGSFFTADGVSWTADSGYRITLDASNPSESWSVKDPAVVRLPDGTYIMAYVTAIP